MDFQGNHKLALATTAFAILGFLGFYFLKKKEKRVVIPEKWQPVGKVSNLYVYPLKSGRRIPLNRANCTQFGVEVCEEDDSAYQLRDRSFVVYGEQNGEFKTARTFPKMLLITVSVHDKKYLAFDAPDMRQLYVEIPTGKNKKVKINMRGETIPAFDCGDEAASWLSRYITNEEKGLRLAFYNLDTKRDANTSFSKDMKTFPNLSSEAMGMFSDMSSVLLINEKSIDDLRERIDENSRPTHEFFRPNIVINDESLAAFAEDNWDFIKIGNCIFRNVIPCTRCIFTTINPENGVRNKNREPLKTLEQYRMIKKRPQEDGSGSPAMGINLQTLQTGIINVDDVIYIGKS